ncbi:glycosyltransferase, group 2 domain containing protein [Acanthamoeba castellanii str. Neff]|uniref:Glycosyltransferase, group 2 domain containing protein n=1 Tax=Acanthamoeba castellanii (strain ATCC 30010 / Neff) TaxID=1257118 RepID=L8HM94_ACACF|nr:glycosyltransferase, group 2 domain containing protein [Acanthamoeba castellanii str. Neff]ELR25511.1 glycosyltransferase, group 2 domain containing protein [Acanthamoeba castellanii str. Neff]
MRFHHHYTCALVALCLIGLMSSLALAYTPADVLRPQGCDAIVYPHGLPSLSVVITALDEDPTLLENTVRSILKHTPGHLLRDIVIVDDASRDQPVRRYMSRTYSKVRVVYNKRGLGVAGARMTGADRSTGDVVVFLDSHMEVTERWAEPFLLHLQNHPDSIVSAVIEGIDPRTQKWESMHPSLHLVTLRVRDLEFKWSGSPPEANITAAPIETASILGAAFGVARKWWEQVGKYDPGLEIWGVENIEIAAKAWMCGTGAYVIPCTRIGHIYWANDTRTRGAYRFEDTTFVARNKARFAQVWMDSYGDSVMKHLSESSGLSDHRLRRLPGLASRHELRQKLHCKSFHWYVENVIYRIARKWGFPLVPEEQS